MFFLNTHFIARHSLTYQPTITSHHKKEDHFCYFVLLLTMLSSLFGFSGGNTDTSKQILNSGNINSAVQLCKYDVRGEIYLAAVKRAQEGKEVIYTNVGNPHAVGESPISFTRQVLSLVSDDVMSACLFVVCTSTLVL